MLLIQYSIATSDMYIIIYVVTFRVLIHALHMFKIIMTFKITLMSEEQDSVLRYLIPEST